MHRLLNRQLTRHFGKDFDLESSDDSLKKFIENISQTYQENENDRKFLEHTLDLNSQELNSLNKVITDKNKEISARLYQYKEAMDSALLVCMTDIYGNITFVNDNFCNITGYLKEELIGQSHTILRDNKEKILDKIFETLNRHEKWQGLLPTKAKDGAIHYINSTIFPLLNVSGEIVDFMEVGDDITLLEQERLKAQSSEKAKSEFLANMSHEIRTPMNGIVGFINLLMNTPLNEKQKHYSKLIKSSSDTLLSIINDILDFSKIESGNVETDFIPCNFHNAFEDTFLMFQHKSDEKCIDYKISIDSKIHNSLNTDYFHLKQVLINLIGNAMKFTQQNGLVSVVFELISDEENYQKIRILVSDNGIGISSEKQNKIFQPFSQVDSSTTRKFGGTGLGLSISKSLLELMNSKLQLESEMDKGSKFYFDLILTKTSTNELEEININNHSEEKNSNEINLTILIAEDYEINQLLLSELLKDKNVQFEIVENGQEAVDKIALNHYDLVLMDINMPVMDGIDATKIIREKLRSDVPIVALTANALEGDKEYFLSMGMDDYLSKPISNDKLYKILEKYSK